MIRLGAANLVLLLAILAATATAQLSPGGFQVWRTVPSKGAVMAASANKSTTTMVPAIVVDDPATTGKARKQNACDKCSLCLAKVGSTSNSRSTFKSIYQDGVYQYDSRSASLDKCLNGRSCRDCGAGTVTYALPTTTFRNFEIKRILANAALPPQSYLLNVQFNIVSE